MVDVTAEELEDLQREVDNLRGSIAIIWRYTASHSTLEVRFLRGDQGGNHHLICEGCSWLEGPDGWSDVDLSIRRNEDGKRRGQLVVLDAKAGFRVTCDLMRVAKNVPPMH